MIRNAGCHRPCPPAQARLANILLTVGAGSVGPMQPPIFPYISKLEPARDESSLFSLAVHRQDGLLHQAQLKTIMALCFACKQIKKIPLRNQRHMFQSASSRYGRQDARTATPLARADSLVFMQNKPPYQTT